MPNPISLFLNLSGTPDGLACGPLLAGAGSFTAAPAPAWVTGSVFTLRLNLFNDSESTVTPTRVTASSIVLAVRKTPGAEDLILLDSDFTEQGDAGEEYYESEVDFSVVSGTWGTNETDAKPLMDIIIDGRVVRVPMDLIRGTYDVSTPPSNPQLYVKTVEQTLTTDQKNQARNNIDAAGTGTSSGYPIRNEGNVTTENAYKLLVVSSADECTAYASDLLAADVVGYVDQTEANTGTRKSQARTNLEAGQANLAGSVTAPRIQVQVTASVACVEGSSTTNQFDVRGLVEGMVLVSENYPSGTVITEVNGVGSLSGYIVTDNAATNDGTFEVAAVCDVSLLLTNAFQNAMLGNLQVVNLEVTGDVIDQLSVSGPLSCSGNFLSSGTITAGGAVTGSNLSGTNTGDQTNISGNAATATALATGRTIGMTGDGTWTSASFNGTGNVTGTLTLATVNTGLSGVFGTATKVGAFTLNAKGQVTLGQEITITPAVGSITGLGSNVATALAIAVGSSGAFTTFSGAHGTPSSITLTNATGLPLSTGLTGTYTPAVDTMLSSTGQATIQPNESAWSSTTLTGSASFSGYNAGVRYIAFNASTAGLVRHAFASGGGHLPGTGNVSGFQVDFSKSFTATWIAQNRCGVASGTKQTLFFGAPTTQANHTLASKGFKVMIEGDGTNVKVSVTGYQSGETASSTANLTTDDRGFYAWRFEWTSGTSAKLYRAGTLLCTLSSGLPSGTGTAGSGNVVGIFEQLSGTATAAEIGLTSITLNHF